MFKRAAVKVDAPWMNMKAGLDQIQVDTDRQICCTMTDVLLGLVRDAGGDGAVASLLERAGAKHSAAYLEKVENWISLDEASALLEAGAVQTGEPAFARRVGESTLRQHAGTQVATLLRSLGSLEAVLKVIAQTTPKLSTVTRIDATDVRPGRAVIRAVAIDGSTRRLSHCEWTAGLLAGTPILFGLPLASIEETECQARGGECCSYTVCWDAGLAAAAADPQQRVTALEAQMVAMSERLQSAYATASDLVSTEDIDTVLHRIVERAANAVRAPSHILAVRTEPGAETQVFSHGIGDREAKLLASSSLEDGVPVAGSTLVVEVTSSRRHYGQLIAHYPGVVQFFTQDREMLSLYAKHAAAVLDMSMALAESAQRHDQVSSLLSLSHALAQAGTSKEVAERLAVAVPEVVDCDRMAVWLWDETTERLTSLSVWGREAEQADYLKGLTISPADTPLLSKMASEPQPLFFGEKTSDPYLRRLMGALDATVLAVVPIVGRDVFLGVLSVSVTDRAERLHPDDELVERLTGVAALAAPAIQNGRLVDTLRHTANHDGLTGLLNRVGFRLHIDGILAAITPGDTKVGLLFIDLNDFKGVNDAYGHEAGDELIRQVAARLGAIGRDSDMVARLGGDEFALILADIDHDDQVRAAEARVRDAFIEPFPLGEVPVSISASVGGGVWPEDGRSVKELVRHADAAMYRDKAELRRGAELPVEAEVLIRARLPIA
jgi:diguanylate cyclase (GGDEF)-like protein